LFKKLNKSISAMNETLPKILFQNINLLLTIFFLIPSRSFPLTLLDLLTQKEEKISLHDFLNHIKTNPSSLIFSWREKEGEWHQLQFQVVGKYLKAEDSRFKVKITPSIYKSGLEISCEIVPKQEIDAPHELLLSSIFDPSKWKRQFYPCPPYLVLPPSSPTTIRFLAEENDWTELKEGPSVFFYPFGVLENDSHFLLWGSLDIGKFALLTPNLIPNHIPAICFRPKRLNKNETLQLELYIKSFPKSKFPRYRDVLRWYIENWKDSDPLTGEILKNAGNIISLKERLRRTLPTGNLVGFPGGEQVSDGKGNLNDWGKYKLQGWQELKIGSLWYYAWHRWDETYPTEGEWVGETSYRIKADILRSDIEALIKAGIHPFLYFRQFLTAEGTYKDKPPYKDWIEVNERGQSSSGYSYRLNPDNAKLVGIEEVHCFPADFGNDSFRLWYFENLKKCIDFYQPAGIAFDMGWAWWSLGEFSRANPKTSNSHAVTRFQADVWNWLREKHPAMRIITNEAFGIPSQLFADGILIEGGAPAGKDELDYESAKAIPTQVISFEYPIYYNGMIQPLDKKDRPYLIVKYRAKGIEAIGDYAIHITEGVPGREATAISLSEIIADGEWHTATVDLRKIENVEMIKGIAIQVQAKEESAYLDIAYIAFSPSPNQTEGEQETPLNRFPSHIDERYTNFWQIRPDWLQNPSKDFSLIKGDGFTRFEVRGKGLGMKWGFNVLKGIIAQRYMKVLSWGACIGGDIWWSPSDEILSFSAQAMGMFPITDSRAIISKDKRLFASGWEDGKDVLIAVYNNSDEEINSVLLLEGNLAKKLKTSHFVFLNAFGDLKANERRNITGREIPIRLSPRCGLLISSKEGVFE
jgi:hypothetical protein